MKRYLTIILAAGAVLALPFSCSVKEEVPGEDNAVTLLYGRAYDATKISIGEPYTESSTTYYKGQWESGDQVKVCRVSDGALLGNASLIEGEGSQNGIFSLAASTGGADVRILYGNSSLPSSQAQSRGGANSFSQYSFAYSGIAGAEGGYNFSLQHVPAFIRLAVKAASTSDTWYGGKLDAVTFRVPGAAVSGDFSVNYETGDLTPGQNVKDFVTVTLETPLTITTSEQEIWLAALPSDLTGCLVTVSLSITKGANAANAMVAFKGRKLLPNSVNTLRISSLQSIVNPGDPDATEYSTVTVQAHNNKTSNYTSYSARLVSGMNRMDKFLVDTRDRWGGYRGVKPEHITSANAEGFWRTGTYHGRPMFIDPDGNVSFLYGVNGVIPDPLSEAAEGPTTNYYDNAFASVEDWALWSADNLANYGFNFFTTGPKRIRLYPVDNSTGLGISAAAQERLHQGNNSSSLSQTENLYFLRTFLWDYNSLTGTTIQTEYDTPFILMFDPEWPDYIGRLARFAAPLFKDNPNFIGYYTDNELPFCDESGSGQPISLQNFLEQKEDYYRCSLPAYNWALQWMQENYGTTDYDSSKETAFVQAVAEYYYRTTAQAIRAADPQHLVMGTRLHSTAKQTQGVVRACARYCDVVTFNLYDYWDISSFPELANIRSWAAGKPVMVTEFYVKNANQTVPGSSTLYKNTEGAGWWVQSQAARGQFYQNNVIHFIEDGTVAGWQWFKWTDDYRSTIPGWVNKGLVVPDYSGLYTGCTNLMKEMHWNLYQCLDYYWGAPVNSGHTAGDIPEGIWE